MKQPAPWFRSVTQQFLAYSMAISVLPLLLLGGIAYSVAYERLYADGRRYLSQLLEDQRDWLDLQLYQVENLMTNLSSVEELRTALQQPIDSAFQSLATRARMGSILSRHTHVQGLVSLDLFGENGVHFSVGDTLNTEYLDRNRQQALFDYMKRAQMRTYWRGFEAHLNGSSRYQQVVMAARLIEEVDAETLERRVLGLLVVSLDPAHFHRHWSPLDLGFGGKLVLINQNQRFVYHPEGRLLGEVSQIPLRMAASERPTIDTVAWQDQWWVMGQVSSRAANWRVVGLVPLAAFDASGRIIGMVTAGTLLLCLLLIGLTAWRYSRAVVQPIRQVTQGFQQFHQGTLDIAQPLAVPSRNEIGDLLEGFNQFLATVAERQRLEARLEHIAYHDSLTDLPNRQYFQRSLEMALGQELAQITVFYLDLDGFKQINDTLGHSAGDRLLQVAALRLQGCMGRNGMVARLGGDEFALFMVTTLPCEVDLWAKRLLERLNQPFWVEGREWHMSGSVGISHYPEHGHDASELLRYADTAMYQAKANGKNQYCVYSHALSEAINSRLNLDMDLRRALREGEFVLYYQPQVSLRTKRIIGVEALLRWRDPRRGLVLPGDFIGQLEDSRILVSVEEWALRTACMQMRLWIDAGFRDLRVSVNVSAHHLVGGHLIHSVQAALAESTLMPSYLGLEITEQSLMENMDDANRVLKEIKRLGVYIELDDFGTGYSSLAYLKQLSVDHLKIDRSFVKDIDSDANDRAIVYSILAMAKTLGLGVIAEGVENQEQVDLLDKGGCEWVQGYFYSPPVESQIFVKMLSQSLSASA